MTPFAAIPTTTSSTLPPTNPYKIFSVCCRADQRPSKIANLADSNMVASKQQNIGTAKKQTIGHQNSKTAESTESIIDR
ncbi:hypothetical protein Syun_009739 [Stephania yunnanensis]|uniref:Uncharacterized protein n=1 Tax=Stephania yunnanensis TaxID=152371 RepID=A0AAP0KG58_9MAGN